MLHIVVCVRISVDTAELRADSRTGAPRLDRAPLRISTFDENALEAAARLKERQGGKVTAVSLVPADPPRDIVLRVLALAADEACLILDETAAEADSLATATILSAALRRLAPWDLILCGEGSLDRYDRQVGPRIAEELGIPPLTQVTRLEPSDGALLVHRALEDRTEVIEGDFPLLLTVGQEINEPRFPTVLQIMGAARKPTVEWRLEDLGLIGDTTSGSLTAMETLSIQAPPTRRKKVLVEGDSAEEIVRNLARRLFEEGVVRTR